MNKSDKNGVYETQYASDRSKIPLSNQKICSRTLMDAVALCFC